MSYPVTVRLSTVLLIVLALLTGLSPQAGAVQKGKKKKRAQPTGTPVMWRDPGDVSALDLLAGPGGEAGRPDLSRVTYIKDETGGYSKKYRVRDGAGKIWVAKIGVEAQPETAAVRLVWAAGYVTEINYLAPTVTIEGKGTFENVRFEARPEGVRRIEPWRWDSNPFAGKRELRGLKVLMAMIENWDLKDDNNKVLHVRGEGGEELHYIVSDLGATFGKTGGQKGLGSLLRNIRGSRNKPEDYAGDKFVDGVEGGRVRFDFEGKNSALMRDITVEDAKWVGGLLAQLSDKQIEDAFRAANYSDADVRTLAGAFRARINELTALQ
jgi:hypothetical protein